MTRALTLERQPWRCDVTGNPVGTDMRMVGAAPCECQRCRAAARIEQLEKALEAAARSLETISRNAGKDELLHEHSEVRAYAANRASAARAALGRQA